MSFLVSGLVFLRRFPGFLLKTHILLVVSVFSMGTSTAGKPGDLPLLEDLGRAEEPVLLAGAVLQQLLGTPVEELAVFSYDASENRFQAIPFQVDERVLHTFNEGTAGEFSEWMYDIFGEDDGLLDENDEIVFLFGDTGDQVPGTAFWLDGAGDVRFEVEVTDDRPGEPVETGWIYVFAGDGLPVSPVTHLTWGGSPSSDIITEDFTLEYDDRWLLTGYRVHAPCGTGEDLIDRVKGRAIPEAGLEEDEETWNLNSEYLGGIVGPVRAIRYVRGAASAVNTIHSDVVYRDFWKRHINLRVHPILEALIYVDWLPVQGAGFFSPEVPDGVLVDGVDDPVPSQYVDWCVYGSTGGGIIVLNDLPDSPHFQEKRFYYRDDASYDDAIPFNPGYSDEDDSAYGNMGLKILDTTDTNLDPIPMTLNFYPVCIGDDGSDLGNAYQERRAHPLQTDTTPQWKLLGPVATLVLAVDGNDLVLEWQQVAGAVTYRVYGADFPDLARESWILLQDSASTTYRGVDEMTAPGSAYYSVVVVGEGGVEEW
jgi:hypothetical protein